MPLLWIAGAYLGAQAATQPIGPFLPEEEPPTIEQSEQVEDTTAPKMKRVYTLVSENDMYGGTDRNYSNGLRLGVFGQSKRANDTLKSLGEVLPFLDLDQTEFWEGYGFGHSIFTPSDIEADIPDPTDHPYAGWLHVSAGLVASSLDHSDQNALGLNIGIVGPSAQGKFVQREFHALIDGKEPKGWDYQLEDELGIELIGQRTKRARAISLGPLEYDSAYSYGLTLGNVRTHASLGGMIRLGVDLDSDWGPPRIRPAVGGIGTFDPDDAIGGYFFLGGEGRYIVRNLFLDGNTFVDDGPRVTGRHHWVGDIQGGFALSAGRVQLALTYVHRTEEFRAQDGPQRFGAISVSIAR